jgi:hypothetical protein
MIGFLTLRRKQRKDFQTWPTQARPGRLHEVTVTNCRHPNILTILFVSPSNFQVIAANNIKNTYSYAMQGDNFRTETMEEDLQIGYRYGYQVVVEHRKSMGQTPRSSL